MANKYWVVWVSYAANQTTDMTRRDKQMEDLIGPRSGSGMGMGHRDLDWTFDNVVDAEDALRKLRENVTDIESGLDENDKED